LDEIKRVAGGQVSGAR